FKRASATAGRRRGWGLSPNQSRKTTSWRASLLWRIPVLNLTDITARHHYRTPEYRYGTCGSGVKRDGGRRSGSLCAVRNGVQVDHEIVMFLRMDFALHARDMHGCVVFLVDSEAMCMLREHIDQLLSPI